jgi:hypothetical protein
MLSAFSSEAGGTEIRAGFVIGEDNQSIDCITDKQGNRFSVEEESFWDTRTGKVVKYTLAVAAGLAGGKIISDALHKDKGGNSSKDDYVAPTTTTTSGDRRSTTTVTPTTPPPTDPPPSDPPPEEERER